ncbi:MAG: HlyD family efflux transporter periplasmic adaptor subunit [Minwuiales bacterium]|nr:HlyD family efflux transporter periplasmic adaptor subunit [Minwuiales bacterium]
MQSKIRVALALVAAVIVVGGGTFWWQGQKGRLPPGIATGNGRLEAEEIDIAARYAGRVVAVLAEEGDTVEQGQVLVEMDTRHLRAQLRQAEALTRQAEQQHRRALAEAAQRKSEAAFADQELGRAVFLVQKGHASVELLDERRTAAETAKAALDAAEARSADAEQSIEAAVADAERIKVELDESTLTAPRNGRVQYRLAEPGEVLPIGGKVLTIIDLNDMYMTLFLPALEAGKVPVGAEARILLDALPDRPIPARVSFVADKAQFTPKEVETASERQKLVFRIKLQVTNGDDPVLKPGMPGVAFVRYDEAAPWPDGIR